MVRRAPWSTAAAALTGVAIPSVPTFYVTERRPLPPAVILLAVLVAGAALAGITDALAHTKRLPFARTHDTPGQAGSSADQQADDKDDDPNQIDTIVLGDPTEAPAPRPRNYHVSPVHPTILIILPHDGKDFGKIPATESGRLLYAWLAAFNASSAPALTTALPTSTPAATVAAQLELRRQTGGFNLIAAKEVEPGLIVFRLRDQTPAANEVLGTLTVRPERIPAAIESFSLRAIPTPAP